MNLGTAQIIQGNALNLPLSDNSVDLICTSPPYFGLRSYQDGGMHYEGQIGSEATPAEFLDALLAATREMVRVLKPSGSIFVNLGDKYSSGSSGDRNTGFNIRYGNAPGRLKQERSQVKSDRIPSMPTKSLIGIPWRYAIRCIDQLQLILRAEIIWAKPNGLPESVTDRVRRSHEQWFHMVKQPRYFSAVDEIREEHTGNAHARGANARVQDWTSGNGVTHRTAHGNPEDFNPLGKLPGSVWSVPTQPLTVPPELGVDHFAAYPMEWPRRIIQGWTPNGICTGCGEGRRLAKDIDWARLPHQIVEKQRISQSVTIRWCAEMADYCDNHGINRKSLDAATGTSDMGGWWASRLPHRCAVPTEEQYARLREWWPSLPDYPEGLWETYSERVSLMDSGDDIAMTGRHQTDGHRRMSSAEYRIVTGYMCGCPTPDAPTTPAVVLDPFGGTGTTALVAKALGRVGITIDLSADYCRLAEWRCNDPRELAAALQVEKPEPIHPDQLDLFDGDYEPALSPRPSGGLAQSKARGQDCTACGYRMQYAARATCEKCGAAR